MHPSTPETIDHPKLPLRSTMSPDRAARVQEVKAELRWQVKTAHGRARAEETMESFNDELFDSCKTQEDVEAAEEYMLEIQGFWNECKTQEVAFARLRGIEKAHPTRRRTSQRESRSIELERRRRSWEDQIRTVDMLGLGLGELGDEELDSANEELHKAREVLIKDLKDELVKHSKKAEGRAAAEVTLKRFRDELYDTRELPGDIKAAEEFLREIERFWVTCKVQAEEEEEEKKQSLNLGLAKELGAVQEGRDVRLATIHQVSKGNDRDSEEFLDVTEDFEDNENEKELLLTPTSSQGEKEVRDGKEYVYIPALDE